ncbi:MAG: cation:proton antiporter [Sulfolobaceae archaeon]|nr:cation:proton antiporter [Sulfolobaceae archaeon]
MNEELISLFDVSLFIFVAEVIRSFLAKYNLPNIVGELVAGMIIGPYALGNIINSLLGFQLISLTSYVQFLAEFSVILLIFASGLEHGITPIKAGGIYSFLGATLGALVPFFVSYYFFYTSFGVDSALFLGVSMGATSLAAVVSIIESERLGGKGIDFLFSASSSDDIVDLILLSTVLTLVGSSKITVQGLALRVIELLTTWLIIFAVSAVLIPRISNKLSDKYIEEYPFVLIFSLTLIMVSLGFSPIIPAFIAGVSLANSSKSKRIREISEILLSIFGSLFFVVIGAEVDLLTINFHVILLSLLLTTIASIFKWIGVFPFAYLKLKDVKLANVVSIGMIPRGETGLVVASIGMSLNALNQVEFESIVLMSLLTTLVGGILFKLLMERIKK